MKKGELRRLRNENEFFRSILRDLQIYAKRYADGRKTAAPSTVNEITGKLLEMGIRLNPGGEGTVWAEDGGGRQFDRLADEQLIPNSQAAVGEYIQLPYGTRIDVAIVKELGTSSPTEALLKIRELKASLTKKKVKISQAPVSTKKHTARK